MTVRPAMPSPSVLSGGNDLRFVGNSITYLRLLALQSPSGTARWYTSMDTENEVQG